jgi:hypothetical protein
MPDCSGLRRKSNAQRLRLAVQQVGWLHGMPV